jgi:hypothetical protein
VESVVGSVGRLHALAKKFLVTVSLVNLPLQNLRDAYLHKITADEGL